ncbi:MAG TPA: hypothetical protein VFN35_01965 [Ktedonobacteraceae bacterium]|nr:hypothetical protein [Ktedonobacteraceae bacterium]
MRDNDQNTVGNRNQRLFRGLSVLPSVDSAFPSNSACNELPAHVASSKAARNQELPFVVFPLQRLPALTLLPGHIPAQDTR